MAVVPRASVRVLAVTQHLGAQSSVGHGAEVHLDERVRSSHLAVDVQG